MHNRPRKPQFPSRPESNTANVTSAIGLEETVGRLRARRATFFTHTVIWVTALVCTAFLLGTLAQAWSNSMLARQVHEEQRDLQQLQTHNKQLTNLAEYYKQPEVIESEARQRLGYTRPGEHAVIFVSAHAQEQQKVQKNNAGAKQQGFWQEWWHTFFGQ